MSQLEKFEAWAKAHYDEYTFQHGLDRRRCEADAWEGWQASYAAALEEAAALIMPSNPPDDWTEYAKIRAEAAEQIRALDRAEGNRPTITGDQSDEYPFPKSLTPPLRRVLSMIMWETGPIAHALRATGADIARKAEDEQAVVLHWLVGFVLEHGDDWHKYAAVALRAMTDSMTKPGEQQP